MEAQGLFVVGTDSGVGKTIITGGLAGALRQQGVDVGVMKPISTGAVEERGRRTSTDALFLKKASKVEDPLEAICPLCLLAPTAPILAASMENLDIHLGSLKDAYDGLAAEHDFMLVEGIGGLLTPLTERTFLADLVRMLNLPLLVVTRRDGGTVNHTLLTIRYAQLVGVEVAGLIINNVRPRATDLAARTNPDLLRQLASVPVFGVIPYSGKISVERGEIGDVVELLWDCAAALHESVYMGPV
ncbi:MAG TPA: dethiobiotin synthase [Armatimonadetes bacterium]|nr:dethiobiotin synthase [Armatimonadota bacterium]